MVWQDIIITIASVVFSVALIPQLIHGFQKKASLIKPMTSVPTFIGLYAVSFSYFTLSLYFSSTTTFITGTIWLLFYIQNILYKEKKSEDSI